MDTVSVLIALLTPSVKRNYQEVDEIMSKDALTARDAFRHKELLNDNELLMGIIHARMEAENRTMDGIIRSGDK